MSILDAVLPASTYRTWCNQSPIGSDYEDIANINPNGSAQTTDYTYASDWNGAAVLVGSARTSVSGTLLSETGQKLRFFPGAPTASPWP